MALVPETKYNLGIDRLLTDSGPLLVGYREGTGVWGFAQSIDIDVSSLAGEASSGYTLANPFKKDLITFVNGITLYLKIYWDTTNNNWIGCINAKYRNTDLTLQEATAAGFNGSMADNLYNHQFFGASAYISGYNYDVPWKMYVFTTYPANPVENVTPAYGLDFNLVAATYFNVISTHTRVDNPLTGFVDYTVKTFAQLVDMPYAAVTQRVDFGLMGWRMYNLDQFNLWSKTAGDGTNDDIAGGTHGEHDPEDDPSHPGGGGGTYDPKSDPIDFPALPTGGALSSGAIKAFLMSTAVTRQLFERLWDSSIFDIALQFQKLVDNPMDCIISLHAIPVVPTIGAVANIKIGSFDTQISSSVITNQYLTIDCGSLNIKEYWGSALDYSPYTTCEIYLPFIGIQKLKVEDVMNSTVHIKYNIDVFTGDCLCNIKCGQSVLYKFSGNLKQDIPVSGRANNMGIKGLLGTAQAFTGAAIGASMGAPPVLAGVAAGISSASSVASSKIITSRSGSLSGSVGLLDDFRPFFIFHRPIQSLASNFKTFKGYPSNITRTLSGVSGYTEVEYINLQNIPNATSAEMDEIKSILTSGAIF